MSDNLICPILRQECIEHRCVMWQHDCCVVFTFFQLSGSVASRQLESIEREQVSGEQAQTAHIEAFLASAPENVALQLIAHARQEGMLDDEGTEVPSEAEESFWQERQLDGYGLPPKVRIMKSKIERLAKAVLNRRSDERTWRKVGQSVSDLVEELLLYAHKQATSDDEVDVRGCARDFWESKGIEDYAIPKDVERKIGEVEGLAEQRVYQERETRVQKGLEEEETKRAQELEAEALRLPQLEQACLRWALGKRMQRLTKQDLEFFLEQSKEDLFPETARTLYLSVNHQLRATR